MKPFKYHISFDCDNPKLFNGGQFIKEYVSFHSANGFLYLNLMRYDIYNAANNQFIEFQKETLFDVKLRGKVVGEIKTTILSTKEDGQHILRKHFKCAYTERMVLKDLVGGGLWIEMSPRLPFDGEGNVMTIEPTINISRKVRHFREWDDVRSTYGYGNIHHRAIMTDFNESCFYNGDLKDAIRMRLEVEQFPDWGIGIAIKPELSTYVRTHLMTVVMSLPKKPPKNTKNLLPLTLFGNYFIDNMEVINEWGLKNPTEFRMMITPLYWDISPYGNLDYLYGFIKSSSLVDLSTIFDKVTITNYNTLIPHNMIVILSDTLSERNLQRHILALIIGRLDESDIDTPNGFLGIHKIRRFIPMLLENIEGGKRLDMGFELLIIILAIRSGDASSLGLRKLLSDVIMREIITEVDIIAQMGSENPQSANSFLNTLASSNLGEYVEIEGLRTLATLVDLR